MGHFASLYQEGAPNLHVLLLEGSEDTLAVHGWWRGHPGNVQEGGRQVNVEDWLVPDGVGLDAGTSHEEGDVGVKIVGEGFTLDQTKLTQMIP